ncbi:pectinesterase inhibitor 28-like [Phragmites australis]|uniref:pectinesterase inhibitor 28-like n=1 Tax=Phragmites australis TaxID=29695 RepID=UPI002D778774|nr:pectinesterase inhibitor 28-like [Phragmites australis]
MHAMSPPQLLACLLLLATAVAPPAAAVCVPRKPGAPGKPGRPAGPSPVPAKPPPPKPKPTPPAPAPPKPTPIIPGADIVKSLCLKTDYPDVCLSSIAKQPQPPVAGGKRLDAAGLLRMAMGAVRGKAAEAKKAAAALDADPKTQPLARGPLQDCVESYDDIAYSLDQAEKAIAGGDRDTTGTMLDTVRTDVDTCDQGFEEREELTPLMAKQDAELAKLASNCLAIATAAGLR